MSHKKQLKEVGLWIGKRFASGAIFATGIAALVAGAYAFQTLTSNPSTAGFTSGGAPMLTRSGGTFDRETMSLEAISDFVTTLSIVTPVNGSQLGYNGGANATSVQLTWNSVPKAVGYTVYMGTSQGNLVQQGTTQSGTTITVNTSKNTTYYWKVQASMPAPYKPKESVISSFITNCPATETLDGGSTCISTKTASTTCAAPSDSTKYFASVGWTYAFANWSTSYQPNVTWNGSTWSNIPTTDGNPVTTPTAGTCQWKVLCPSGYSLNSTINRCEKTFFSNSVLLGSDDAWGASFWTVYSRCPANHFLSSVTLSESVSWNSYSWNYPYNRCLVAYSGTSSNWVVWQSTNTGLSDWYANPNTYGKTTYSNTNTNIDWIALSGWASTNNYSCNTWWYEPTRAIQWYSIWNANLGWQFSTYYSYWYWAAAGTCASDQCAKYSSYWSFAVYDIKCALK
jgi:hypothetical protein